MTVSCWTVVEADDADAALEMAGDRGVSSLSGNVGDDETECWNFDNDGEPQGFSVVPWELSTGRIRRAKYEASN